MDKEKAALIAREYVEFIRKKDPNIKKAYIFGSFAKGTDREDSDIDLAIIFKNLTDPFDMQVRLMKLRRQFDTRIEPHPFARFEFEKNQACLRLLPDQENMQVHDIGEGGAGFKQV